MGELSESRRSNSSRMAGTPCTESFEMCSLIEILTVVVEEMASSHSFEMRERFEVRSE